MNPKAKGMVPSELPPLDEIRGNRRIRWYRCPIEPARLRELAQPDDSRGLLQAMGHLGIWATTGIVSWSLFTLELWWGFCIALFLHGTVAAFFTAPHHELCHTTVFRTRWLNEFFLRIFSFLGWLNFEVYRFSHSDHHRFTLFTVSTVRGRRDGECGSARGVVRGTGAAGPDLTGSATSRQECFATAIGASPTPGCSDLRRVGRLAPRPQKFSHQGRTSISSDQAERSWQWSA